MVPTSGQVTRMAWQDSRPGAAARGRSRGYLIDMKKPQAQSAIDRDLQAERAAALARATEHLESSLTAFAAADAGHAVAPTPATRERRREALALAGERLWYLVIQREAVGMRRHDDLYEVLRVPREVRAAMGPRRRR